MKYTYQYLEDAWTKGYLNFIKKFVSVKININGINIKCELNKYCVYIQIDCTLFTITINYFKCYLF